MVSLQFFLLAYPMPSGNTTLYTRLAKTYLYLLKRLMILPLVALFSLLDFYIMGRLHRRAFLCERSLYIGVRNSNLEVANGETWKT